MEWVALQMWQQKVIIFLAISKVSRENHGTAVLWMGSQQEKEELPEKLSDSIVLEA